MPPTGSNFNPVYSPGFPWPDSPAVAGQVRERVMRGLDALTDYDPLYWADHGPDAIDLARIRVGDHQWDVLAQAFRSCAKPPPGRPDDPPDAYLTGLAELGIPPGGAGDYGFAGPDEGQVALIQGFHIFTLRTASDRPPPIPPSTRKEHHP